MMKKILLSFVLAGVSNIGSLSAQCVASAFMVPGTTGNNGLVGLRDWNLDGNVTSSNDVYTSVTALLIGDDTHYHISSNYGFAIPSSAVICGIEVRVEKGEFGILANVKDNSVRIIKGGTITGNDHALASGWGGTDATSTYGSSSDTWGVSWTPADINSGSFGLAFSANLGGVAVLPTARIDQIRIRVWYNDLLPVSMTGFNSSCQGENILLKWETASETASDHFTLQHSTNGYDYTNVATLAGNGTTNVTRQYAVEHTGAGKNSQNHYRLVLFNTNGDSVLLHQEETGGCHTESAYMQVNQLNDQNIQVQLHGFNHQVNLSLLDLSGNVLYTYAKEVVSEHELIHLDQTPQLNAGCYLVVARCQEKHYVCKLVVVK